MALAFQERANDSEASIVQDSKLMLALDSRTLAHFAPNRLYVATKKLIGLWRAELVRFVPQSVRCALERDPYSLQIRVEPGQPAYTVIGSQRLPVDPDTLASMARWKRLLVTATITVPQRCCFIRQFTLPRSALAEGNEVVRLDLERTTPFKPDQVYSDWFVLDDDDTSAYVSIRQVVLKRNVVQPILDDLAASGVPVRSLAVADDHGGTLPVNLVQVFQRARLIRLLWRAITTAALIMIALSSVATGARIVSLSSEITRNQEISRQLQARHQAIRRQISDAETFAATMATARARKAATVATIALLEELTRLLPDSTWLTEFRTEKDTGFISGQSSNASELIRLLSKSTMMRSFSFTSPVVRDPLKGVERFQMRFDIGSAASTPGHGPSKAPK